MQHALKTGKAEADFDAAVETNQRLRAHILSQTKAIDSYASSYASSYAAGVGASRPLTPSSRSERYAAQPTTHTGAPLSAAAAYPTPSAYTQTPSGKGLTTGGVASSTPERLSERGVYLNRAARSPYTDAGLGDAALRDAGLRAPTESADALLSTSVASYFDWHSMPSPAKPPAPPPPLRVTNPFASVHAHPTPASHTSAVLTPTGPTRRTS